MAWKCVTQQTGLCTSCLAFKFEDIHTHRLQIGWFHVVDTDLFVMDPRVQHLESGQTYFLQQIVYKNQGSNLKQPETAAMRSAKL